MQSLKKKLTAIILIAAAIAIPAQSAMAQWNIGASYQIRQESPKHGFGLRIEREILQKLPLVDLRIRAHFAYFNENNDISLQGDPNITLGEVTYYDYGLSGIAGVSLGLLTPYVGLGIGANTIDFIKNKDDDISETNFVWSGLVGAEISILPKIHPFIEYRFQPAEDYKDAIENAKNDIFDSNGRLVIGLSISL